MVNSFLTPSAYDIGHKLVEGVAAHRAEIDGHLGRLAEEWTVDRMASLDRTILRIACFELLHQPDTPPGAAIDEAVQAAKELSTEDSSRFVNGILGRLVREQAEALRSVLRTRSAERYWSRAWPKYISSQIASSLWVSTNSPPRYREISMCPTNRR